MSRVERDEPAQSRTCALSVLERAPIFVSASAQRTPSLQHRIGQLIGVRSERAADITGDKVRGSEADSVITLPYQPDRLDIYVNSHDLAST